MRVLLDSHRQQPQQVPDKDEAGWAAPDPVREAADGDTALPLRRPQRQRARRLRQRPQHRSDDNKAGEQDWPGPEPAEEAAAAGTGGLPRRPQRHVRRRLPPEDSSSDQAAGGDAAPSWAAPADAAPAVQQQGRTRSAGGQQQQQLARPAEAYEWLQVG